MANKTTDQKIDDLAISLNQLTTAVKLGFDGVDKRFDEMDKRFDRLEFLTTGHDNRIDALEDKMLQVARKIGLKFN